MEEKAMQNPAGNDFEEATKPLLLGGEHGRGNGDVQLNLRESHLEYFKSSDWRAPLIILGFQCLESVGLNGISDNLVIYLSNVLHESNAFIATSITTWTGTGFLTPLIGALIADSYLGSYRMIFFSSLLYLLGTVVVTVSACVPTMIPSPCSQYTCQSATHFQKLVFFSGLYMIAFGSGGVKSSLLPLGADQFDEDNPRDRESKASFFNWFYFCMNIGALLSSTLIVWIQDNVHWGIGYGISTLSMTLAVAIFLCGTSTFKLHKARRSPLKNILDMSLPSLRKFGKANLNNPPLHAVHAKDSNCDADERAPHTVTATSLKHVKEGTCQTPERSSAVNELKDLKLFLRLFPIWFTGILYSVPYAQMSTTFVEQARVMDNRIGSFKIPPASLYAFQVLSVMLWVVLYDTVIVTVAGCYSKAGTGLTQLQRMGIGYFLIVVCMATAAVVEMKRLESINARNKPLNIMWQLPQFFLIAGSEVFTYIGQLEFFYDQGPDTMRNLSTSVSLLTISLGNYMSSFIVSLVAKLTSMGDSHGWIPEDLNKGHLDYFFLLLAATGVLNFVAYVFCAWRFDSKKNH